MNDFHKLDCDFDLFAYQQAHELMILAYAF
jgi:hypothetical protein